MSDPSRGDLCSRGLCGKGKALGDMAEYIGVSAQRPGESRPGRFDICTGRLSVGGRRASRDEEPRDHGSLTDRLRPDGLDVLCSL